MDYTWAIWKPYVESSGVRFVPDSDLPASGFASVYRFSEADARSMQAAGTYKQFKGVVHSTHLKVDCDTEDASQVVERWAEKEGIAYDKYTTGNRGFHFHILRETLPHHSLPSFDKAFAKDNFTGCDLSIYHHVAMYRQVGCTHKKTGRKKELIKSVPGKALIYEIHDPMDGEETYSSFGLRGATDISSVFGDRSLAGLTIPASNGKRHEMLTKVAVRLDMLGQPEEMAYAYLFNVNLMYEPPLPDTDVRRILTWAYHLRNK